MLDHYRSIEQRFPEWEEARQVIEENIPTRITFKLDTVDKKLVTLDQDFIEVISNICSEYPRKVLKSYDSGKVFWNYSINILNKKGQINGHYFEIFTELKSDFSNLLYRPLDRMTLDIFADIWNSNDDRRKAKGLETSIDIINHCFGVRSAIPIVIPCVVSSYRTPV